MTRRELFAALIAPLVAVKAIAAPRKMSPLDTQYWAGRVGWAPEFNFYEYPLCQLCYDRGYIDTGRPAWINGHQYDGGIFECPCRAMAQVEAIMKTYPKWPHVISGKEINTQV